jgi:Ser/Thr protein kinase RdoA (MazF antagonist)
MQKVTVGSSARSTQQRRFAAEALAAFGLADATYKLIKLGTTTTFRVLSPTREQFALRLQTASRMPIAVVQSELLWLAELRRQTALLVPAPVSAQDGAQAVLLPALANREAQIATLFHWLPGRHKQRLTEHDAELMGVSLGTLHLFSSTYQPPSNFERWHFDRDAFIENAAVLDTVALDVLPSAAVRQLRNALGFVQTMLDVLDREPSAYGLIQADTNTTNWLFQRSQVALLDFEVCCYGYYLFDVGRLLHEFERGQARGAQLAVAFHRGYTSVRPLPALRDARVQAGKLMSLIDIVVWACTLEPWMQQAWGIDRLQGAVQQIQQAMAGRD